MGSEMCIRDRINTGDSVLMEIEQEVSSVAEQSNGDPLGATFNTRLVKNAVLVDSGSTVVVGGLLDTSHNRAESRVPLLGSIPLIGRLFRYSSDKQSKRNLMLFIRPTIIRQQQGFDRASNDKRDKFRSHLDEAGEDRPLKQALKAQLQTQTSNHALLQMQRDITAFYRGE